MSTDTCLWTINPIDLPGCLPDAENWKPNWEYEGDGWLVGVCKGSDPFSDEEIKPSEEILALNANATTPYQIHIEPISANEEGYKFFQATVEAAAVSGGGGVIETGFGNFELDSNGKQT